MGNVVIILSGEERPILKTAETSQLQELEKSFLQQDLGLLEIGNDVIIFFEKNQTDFEKPTLFLLNGSGEAEISLSGDLVFLSREINEGNGLNLAFLSLEQEEYLELSLFLEYHPDRDNDFYFVFEPKKFEGYHTIDSYNTIEFDLDLTSAEIQIS